MQITQTDENRWNGSNTRDRGADTFTAQTVRKKWEYYERADNNMVVCVNRRRGTDVVYRGSCTQDLA